MGIWKSRIKPIIYWLHLWLGLFSGLILFVVSITGALSVFEQEIKDLMEPWRFVEAQDQSFAPPSQLLDTAARYVPGQAATGLTYEDKEGAAAVGFWSQEGANNVFSVVFLNPYTAEFIRKDTHFAEGTFDFFHFIMDGHRALWLPYEIGQPIVGIGSLIFLFLLLSGLIMWWPKSWRKSESKRAFKIKWKGSFKRLNHDLHNVLGFYVLVFALVIVVTGLVWSFDWFGKAVYYMTSGGKSKTEHVHPHSDVAHKHLANNDTIPAIDRAFYKAFEVEPNPQRIYMTPTLTEEDASIEIVFFKYQGKFYHHNTYFFDRYTLEPLRVENDRYDEADFGHRLAEMNYDLHTGRILGLPGKILAFLVSLILASLPVTGFLIWYQKQRKKKKQRQSLLEQLHS
ncbi:PepSY-associated TM helix domain-containing protein [Geofilum rubicundum]|uniref:Putative iron-regulated membrane protein n=1 Tax=Geofilum rubicundum JCM 15548 TaxID=1236989 RepID=A0A0E9M1J9_9BACT|nr:PepSY-associated TM helix domain-containing protein [Geofilum rubicundum]GAO31682.1 putative iron-regulated membrane protein [Geofilum rubicundum JCM 15548]